MPRATMLRQRLLVLFLTGMLLFFSPLALQVDTLGRWAGIPVIFIYLFGAWAGLIGLAAWVVSRTRD